MNHGSNVSMRQFLLFIMNEKQFDWKKKEKQIEIVLQLIVFSYLP